MNDKLNRLISEANGRIKGENAAKEAELKRQQDEKLEQDFQSFKSHVENALSPEILDAIGPVTFDKYQWKNWMSFTQDSYFFKLKQVDGTLTELEEKDDEQSSSQILGQFDILNPDAKDVFLHMLGTSSKKF